MNLFTVFIIDYLPFRSGILETLHESMLKILTQNQSNSQLPVIPSPSEKSTPRRRPILVGSDIPRILRERWRRSRGAAERARGSGVESKSALATKEAKIVGPRGTDGRPGAQGVGGGEAGPRGPRGRAEEIQRRCSADSESRESESRQAPGHKR